MRVARLWLLMGVAVAGGCGGGNGDPPTGNTVFASVSVDPANPTVIVGLTTQLTATAKDQNGGNMSGATFAYQSNNQAIATVTNTGLVTGVAAGTARIAVTGTIAGVSKTTNVDVNVADAGPSATVIATAGSQFDPRQVAITRQGTVTWQFNLLHNVTFDNVSGAPADIADKGSGSESRQFNTAGTFTYHCTIHNGMNGTVVVK
ncbi:MAG: cell surface protein [Geminicoccaceae bacterium]|jgi:plastocyanin|nr:cell surface protein [Geminicoccaceae bacterium]